MPEAIEPAIANRGMMGTAANWDRIDIMASVCEHGFRAIQQAQRVARLQGPTVRGEAHSPHTVAPFVKSRVTVPSAVTTV